jgi:hypothetical protein
MKIAIRALVYAVLIGLALWTGRGFVDSFRSGTGARDLTELALTSTESPKSTPKATPPVEGNSETNASAMVEGTSNLVESAAGSVTNSGVDPSSVAQEPTLPGGFETNSNSNAVAEVVPPVSEQTPAPTETGNAAPSQGKKKAGNRMIPFLGGFVLSIAALGLLAARDFSLFFADKSLEFLFNDDGKGVRNRELEEAEAVWSSGDRLESILLMRAYYEKNPREVFVALRIAEIYEADLGNYLAAALELEEVLTKKLPPERWGWTAIRLCNLYSKLDKTDKAIELLRRVAVEYSATPAAEKARKRLQQVDPEFFATLPVPGHSDADVEEEAEAESQAGTDRGNLPPGFRPKK